MIPNKEFKDELKALAIPFIISNILANSFTFIDTLMIGNLGEKAIAAMSIAGQFSFILGLLLSSVYGITIYLVQFYGAGDWGNFRKTQGIMLFSGILVSIFIFFVIFLLKYPLVELFTRDEEVIAMAVDYLTIISFVYIINAIKDSYLQSLQAIGKVKFTLVIGFIGMGINTIFNYLLIYGNLSFPALGVSGAAYATGISSILSTFIVLGYIYLKKYYVHSTLKELTRFDWSFIKVIYSRTLPLLFHEASWSIGNVIYAMAFGVIGVYALASFELVRMIVNFFMLGVYGFSYSARVMIGKKLSQNNKEMAIDYSRKFTKITAYSAIVMSLLLLLLNPVIVHLFPNVSEVMKTTFSHLLYIQGFLLIFYFLNNMWIVGVFRSGGDTMYTFKLIFITTWLITMPLLFFSVYVMKWPVEIVFLIFTLEEITKMFIGSFRYRSNKWVNNLVSDWELSK